MGGHKKGKRSRARSGSNLSLGSANEKLSHKEALKSKFDVITQKQANNICIAELEVPSEGAGTTSVKINNDEAPKGLNNMGNT